VDYYNQLKEINMKTLFVIIAALAAVTFPVYLVVFIFKSLILGLMTLLVSVIWMFYQLMLKLKFSRNKSNSIKLIRR
jgi:fatty acid desaturase